MEGKYEPSNPNPVHHIGSNIISCQHCFPKLDSKMFSNQGPAGVLCPETQPSYIFQINSL